MCPSHIRLPLAALLLFAPAIAYAGMKIAGTPKVTFEATGSPGFLDIEGVTSAMTAADDGTNLTFIVAMDTLDSGISLRDEHMKEKYLETAQYPKATLSFPRSTLPWPTEVGKSVKGTLTATFTVHGTARPVAVDYTVKRSNTGYHVTAKFPYNASDHGIAIPSYLGVTVDPAQHAEANLDLIETP